MRSWMGRCLLLGLLPDKRAWGMNLLSLSQIAQIKHSGSFWPIAPSLPETCVPILLVLFLEWRIRDKANPLSARSAHKLRGDENILIQTKESQVQRTVLRSVFFFFFFFSFLSLSVPLIFGAETTPQGIYNEWNI